MNMIISILMLPIMILNMLGGLVAGIWLAVLGEWGAIGVGLILLFGSHIALSFALMPSMLFVIPAAYFIEKRNKVGMAIFTFLNLFYAMGLITVWCIGILYYFTSKATSQSIVPLLVWSSEIALSPWMFLAWKDQQGGGNEYSIFTVFLAQISYIIAILMILFARATLFNILTVFAVIMGIGLVVQLVIALIEKR